MPARAPTAWCRRCFFFLFPCRHLLLAAIISLLSSLPVHADEPQPGISEELELLKEEDVSIALGLGREQPISQAASNVYVITEEDIRHSGAIDLPTVLRRIPGIEVIQMTGAHFDVSMRGDNQSRANKLLVLVDGRSIYLDMQGEVLWKTIPVTLPEIKKIEVLKGPASALYGFNAFDGVINIITKSAEEMKGATLQFGGGAYGTITSAAVYAGTYNKLGYRLSLGRDQNQQWRRGDALAFRTHKFNIQTDYALTGNSRVRLSGGIMDSNRYDGPIVDIVTIAQKPTIGYVHAVYERPDFFIRGWWTSLDQPNTVGVFPAVTGIRIVDRNGTNQQTINWNSYNVEVQQALSLGAGNRLTFGVNYRNNGVKGNFLTEFTSEDRLGFYAQDEWQITDRLKAQAGVRYDLDTFINPTLSPRFSLIFSPVENHTFRAGIAVAYRPPTIFENSTDSRACLSPPFTPPAPPCGGGFTTTSLTGSNLLQPEQMVSYDVGYQGWYWKHRLRVRADLFLNHISDLISQRPVGLNLTFRNGREADIYGGEAGFEVLATSWLTGFANYSFQEITQSFTGLDRRGGPKYKANAGLRGEWENGLNGEIALHYYGAATYPLGTSLLNAGLNQKVGSYVLLNMRGAYVFWKEKGKDKAEIAVTAFNALNDQHKEHPEGDTIGSRVMGWLTIKY